MKSTVRYLFGKEKIQKKMLGRKKTLNYYFKIFSGPMCKFCVTSPLKSYQLPLGSSSNVSRSLGGLCMISSLPISAAPLIPLPPLSQRLWTVLLACSKQGLSFSNALVPGLECSSSAHLPTHLTAGKIQV